MAARLGCPTANVAVSEGTLIPALGVYVAETEFGGKSFPSVVCVNDGRDGSRLKMEVHLLHQQVADLQGRFLNVRLITKLRDLVPWRGEEEMRHLVKKDLEQADGWFRSHETLTA